MVRDVVREQEFSALHGSVVENDIKSKELKVWVESKMQVLIVNEVLDPLMKVDFVVVVEGDVSGTCWEEGREGHRK